MVTKNKKRKRRYRYRYFMNKRMQRLIFYMKNELITIVNAYVYHFNYIKIINLRNLNFAFIALVVHNRGNREWSF